MRRWFAPRKSSRSAFFLVILYDLRSLSLWGWGKYCILIDRTTRGREKIDLIPKSSAAVSSLIVQSIALEMHVENARFQRNAVEVLELRHVPGCPSFWIFSSTYTSHLQRPKKTFFLLFDQTDFRNFTQRFQEKSLKTSKSTRVIRKT